LLGVDHNTQQGKGVGFVKYATRKEGQDAIRGLNNETVPQNSKSLHVKVRLFDFVLVFWTT
jgi:hypothetical protein